MTEMKKKVAIQTLQLVNNYGGILQAFALQHALGKLGCDVVMLNRYNKATGFVLNLKIVVSRFINRRLHKVTDNVNKKYTHFLNKRINLTQPLLSKKHWEHYILSNNFDAVIVGSDQVWRLEYVNSLSPEFFLDFKKGKIKKASYAASFGIETFNAESKDEIQRMLQQFDGISVREDAGLRIIENNFALKGFHHLDPTLLLTQEEYIEAFDLDKTDIRNSIFCYVLDKSTTKQDIIHQVQNLLNKDVDFVYGAGVSKDNYTDSDMLKKPSIEQWIQNIASASFVITDSFHGMMFSVIFNKPFIVIGNEKRGLSRFTSFLTKMNLEERLVVLKHPIIEKNLLIKDIDYNRVNDLIEKERQISYQYLNSILQ